MCWTGGTAEFGATPTGQWCTDFILQRSSLDKGSLIKGAPSALFYLGGFPRWFVITQNKFAEENMHSWWWSWP